MIKIVERTIGTASDGAVIKVPYAVWLAEYNKALAHREENGNVGLINSAYHEANMQCWYTYGY